MLKTIVRFSFGAVLSFGLLQTAMADDNAEPILMITGEIAPESGETALSLDLEALRQLPVTTFETSTIWTDGVYSFTGVSLADMMDALGVQDGTIIAKAINDYAVEIPVSDAVEGGPIIAYLMDGAEMTVRDKGPLWVIYPYESDADYRTEVVYSRSIWQLDRLDIVE